MSSGRIQTLFWPKKQGFLLIELLVGLSILSIVVLGVGGYLYQVAQLQADGANRLRAVSIARCALEALCANHEERMKPKEDHFTLEWQLKPDPHTGYSRAWVRVAWQERKGVVRSVTLDSGVAHERV